MFEKFLEQQEQSYEDISTKCGIIFMSGASPLTFALEEVQNRAALHDAVSQFSQCGETTRVEQNVHPSHLSSQDIGYLKLKGAFDSPTPEVLRAMVASFIERFCPLYSIVDLSDFKELFKSQRLPWILQHSVCFIGATFCDSSVMHRAEFKGRLHARRQFYDKAKILFDIGYETNKIVLLQTVIMLSFWGPQMKSYWNPCSWVGFGVTVAESLGLHRIEPAVDMDRKRKSLLKRLFWALACDTGSLVLEDFDHDDVPGNGTAGESVLHAHYQIQISRLSLILRNIVEARFDACRNVTQTACLHEKLDKWQSELPAVMTCWLQEPTPHIFSTSLKIIFHLHIILNHLEKSDRLASNGSYLSTMNSSSQIAESAAQVISSTAFTTVSMLGIMPHETFSGFFVAGIVFYRGFKQQQDTLARLSRSALDNCQMVISEARERWDPASWVMRIFDFLLSSNNTKPTDTSTRIDLRSSSVSGAYLAGDSIPFFNDNGFANGIPANDMLHSIDFSSPTYQGMGWMANEFFPMSNFLPMSFENPPYMPA